MIPYKLTFEQRPGYLYAKIQADDIDRETALSYLGKVADKCRELGVRNVLLERDIPVMLNDSDLLFTTADFSRMMKNRRVAFLNPHLAIDEDMDFSMVIATNRNAQFTLHRSVEEAEKWLIAP